MIEEVVLDGHDKVVIKLRDGRAITVMPGIQMIDKVKFEWKDGRITDVKIDGIDEKTFKLCVERAFLVYTIKTVMGGSH
jgi:hypothetical protein